MAEAWFNLDAFLATGMVGVSTGTCWVGAKGCLEEEVGYTLGVKVRNDIHHLGCPGGRLWGQSAFSFSAAGRKTGN